MTTISYKPFHLLILTFVCLLVKCQQQQQSQGKVLTNSQIWGFGFLAGFGISAIGFGTAIVMVVCKKMASDGCFQMIIKFFFSLAFGALLGDAMIHILPQAYKAENSDARVVAGIFIGSIVFFLILERVFQRCGVTHQHWHSNQCHDDHQGAIQNHNHPNKIQNEQINPANISGTIKVLPLSSNKLIEENQTHSHNCKSHHHEAGKKSQIDENNKHDKSDDEKSQQNKSCLQNLKGKGSAGYMNLLGSLVHNFIDGLALGVAFATGHSKDFVPVLIAIIAHQIPRQMGDVAILMTNKFNGMQSILCNGIVNMISLVGVIIGLAVTNLDTLAKQYVLVFVAGNFIYIAGDIWKHLFKNSGFLKNLVEFIGFGIGITAMYLVLLIQSNSEGHDH